MRSKFASLYLALAAAAALWTGSNASAHVIAYDEPKLALSDPINPTRDITAESNLYCLALAVFFEGGSSSESE